jgi:alanine racemase
MDYFMVDLTDVEAATGPISAGEEIVLIGEQQGGAIFVDELAKRASTITYEIFTGIGERVPRHYVR